MSAGLHSYQFSIVFLVLFLPIVLYVRFETHTHTHLYEWTVKDGKRKRERNRFRSRSAKQNSHLAHKNSSMNVKMMHVKLFILCSSIGSSCWCSRVVIHSIFVLFRWESCFRTTHTHTHTHFHWTDFYAFRFVCYTYCFAVRYLLFVRMRLAIRLIVHLSQIQIAMNVYQSMTFGSRVHLCVSAELMSTVLFWFWSIRLLKW